MEKKKTLVLGASDNPARYSYMAVDRLRANGYPVVAVGRKQTVVKDVMVDTEIKTAQDIDTVTLYLNPANQRPFYEYILSLEPRRVIFNPGTENPEFISLLREYNIYPEIACTLVLLSLSSY